MAENLLTATIGASVVVLGLVVSKETKTSEFRQQWIDELRNDLSDFISLSFDIALKGGANESVLGDENQLEAWEKANRCLARIKLRINPTESLHQELIQKLKNLEKSATHPNAKIESFAEQVVECSQRVLKAEWKRVKRGEWRYIFLLAFSSTSLLTCIGYLGVRWILAK